MLKWAIVFAVAAAVAAMLGLSGLTGALAGIAKLLFYTALAVCLMLLVFGLAIDWKVARPLLQRLRNGRYDANKRWNRL